MSLNQGQQAVLDSAMKFVTSKSEQFMVIKGKPGTGKSYLTKAIVEGIEKYMTIVNSLMANPSDTEIHLTATTNKAAAVLAEFIGRDTQTIHSLIGLTLPILLLSITLNLSSTSSFPFHLNLSITCPFSFLRNKYWFVTISTLYLPS